MTTLSADTLPDALGAPAREFISQPHRLLIGAERLDAADGRTFATLDPATGREIAEVALGGPEDVARAVAAARAAFSRRSVGLDARGRARAPDARARATRSKTRAEEIAQIESLDNGKPVGLAQYVDVNGAVGHLRYFAGWPTKIEGNVLPVSAPNMHCYTRREPVGVCAQIIPWNFPLLMAAWKLGAGARRRLHDRAQARRADAAERAAPRRAGARGRLPAGRAQRAHRRRRAPARRSSITPGVDKIAFTGSTAVGREIGAKAGRALKRVTLELGGKSPNIILPDADIDAAVKGSFQAIYFNSGQACNAGSRLFVPAERFDEVMSALAEAAKRRAARSGARPRHAARAARLGRAAASA